MLLKCFCLWVACLKNCHMVAWKAWEHRNYNLRVWVYSLAKRYRDGSREGSVLNESPFSLLFLCGIFEVTFSNDNVFDVLPAHMFPWLCILLLHMSILFLLTFTLEDNTIDSDCYLGESFWVKRLLLSLYPCPPKGSLCLFSETDSISRGWVNFQYFLFYSISYRL